LDINRTGADKKLLLKENHVYKLLQVLNAEESIDLGTFLKIWLQIFPCTIGKKCKTLIAQPQSSAIDFVKPRE